MYKGAVFFDYDGTITDENSYIYSPTPKTVAALEKLRANGYATFLATGRMKPLTTLVSGKFTGLITSNGAYCEIDGKCINDISIPSSELNEIVRFMNQEKIYYAFETSKCAYTNGLADTHFLYVLDHFRLPKSLFKPLTDKFTGNAYKIIVTYDSEEKLQKLSDKFSDRFSIKPHRFCLSADVNDISISKATGVNAVIEKLNIPIENTYAFGDGENDITMLNAVRHGIAMGEHSKKLENVCEYITGTVKQDGIYTALTDKYKLI